ncbi:TetR/AcrR family transcriptional regulator [Christensenella tenuis]|uniref:TetR/AcrR family transcriptional regulator n=1 Tax=Christensenella tenuis TaxID=2763033 RepID=A0ABR7EIZ4_9FIRM|nr:TetR/AcrR family transcriptional regulator [Christensenella tenuis]MBC5649114.1 TetR/AcrR family transcriptional regulator [Christensenella tenuis]
MTSPSYKEKELLIMRALLRLLSGGMSIAEIKASDIAQEAGIGKGTLYNYFDTKEEIFARTIIYSIDTQLHAIFEQMNKVRDFKGKCYTVLRIAHEIASNENSDFHLLLFNLGGKDMKQLMGGDMSFVWRYLSIIRDKVTLLAQAGAAEGLFPPPCDEEYAYSAFAAALMSFVHARCRMDLPTDKALERAMDNAYTLLLKALN